MESEMFTFVVLSHEGYQVEHVFLSRREADKKFDAMLVHNLVCVAYYCASTGGLVNAYHAD